MSDLDLEIDLTGYDTDRKRRVSYNRHYNNTPMWELSDTDEAKRAAKDSGLTRQCNKVDKIILNIPMRVVGFTQDFLMHFMGPAARKLTPPVLESKLVLRVGAKELSVTDTFDGMGSEIRSYLMTEEHRIAQRAEKKAAIKPDNIVWGEPTGIFVPDINTKLRLVLPWNFTVYNEYRNSSFLNFIQGEKNNKWSYYGRSGASWDVQMKEGSIIIVDRVYIRKGKGFEDFSSLTFRMQKGSTIIYNGVTLTAKGNHRFWAKLRHVNQIVAEVDLNSLPGQEKEGIARK